MTTSFATPVAPIEPKAADILERLRSSLPQQVSAGALDPAVVPSTGDHSLNEWVISPDFLALARPAAVLVGLVPRGDTLHLLLTQRTADLREHAGQIAFPGGKMEPSDTSPAATALREAEEEIALPRDRVEVVGYLDPYLTRTGFRIIPVIARIEPPFAFTCNPAEVVEAFELPFSIFMDRTFYSLSQRDWHGATRSFYSVTYGDRTVWGITAGILHILCERLEGP